MTVTSRRPSSSEYVYIGDFHDNSNAVDRGSPNKLLQRYSFAKGCQLRWQEKFRMQPLAETRPETDGVWKDGARWDTSECRSKDDPHDSAMKQTLAW
ncbi:hypothetical protein H8B02_12745 [Bradyrhizobium sp. Pear77]|uniref:hypothetical protein n=1 Tax=Bradyrhizobium altum TaxID=1571202 RepID=UPI001E48399D|nr:hypothetical protein [Bradyrhizobium altum]MCC8954290.1 hypothetical protein [Bradyrhizobium altum]